MKSSSKPIIFFNLSVFLMVALLILAYIGFKLECEKLVREKYETSNSLTDIRNQRTNLVAEDQSLSSEERIVGIAQNDLGMVKRTNSAITLNVSKAEIEKITAQIQKKYE